LAWVLNLQLRSSHRHRSGQRRFRFSQPSRPAQIASQRIRSIIPHMDTTNLRESATDAIRFWEPRRLIYNAVLAAIVLLYFAGSYPASKAQLTVDGALGVFLLAVLANIAYCTAYVVDIFAQLSDYRDLWRKFRWILFLIGILFAGTVTRLFAMGIFQGHSY
jgi:hypothetical protein